MKKNFLILVVSLISCACQAIETKELKYIGMPVGGICAGQVYLGGDGQLWNWDIFNVSQIKSGEAGCRFYVNPMVPSKAFENGFGLKVKDGHRIFYRPLDKNGFSDIRFEGEYPIGNVYYKDVSCPVSVSLKAYSPFIPTDADNSGIPVTILEYTVVNNRKNTVVVDITGWLQNMSGFQMGKGKDGKHVNRVDHTDNYKRLVCETSNNLKNEIADWGSMSLTLLGDGKASAEVSVDKGIDLWFGKEKSEKAEVDLGDKLVGSVSGEVTLKQGESKTFTYLISWYYPNVHLWNRAHDWKDRKYLRHYYSKEFKDSEDVANYVIANKWLLDETKKWKEIWYDSSLPKWFLDRTFTNVSTLATTACLRFHDINNNPENEGRFYTFEGVSLGQGTCTHVFHYEQVLGRIFPDMARQLREQIDLGLSYKDDGCIGYRGEFSDIGQHDGRGYAADGHAGTILRIYREHTMSKNDTFLKNNWQKIKKSVEYIINHDKEKDGMADGILEGVQYNTLDRIWYGKNAWISGLYAASLKAGAEMALAMGDKKFSKTCSEIASLAYKNISAELFDGEYFIHKLDSDHMDSPNTNIGCHIDQLLGQYWSTQVGLGDILPKEQIKSALKSIVKYNYVDNYGNYLDHAYIPIKRWYADDDESGTVMCSFPKGGGAQAPGQTTNEWEKLVVGYFSEIWTGQEHQLAATLIAEGLVDEAMKVLKAVHQRYSPERRNPYNEIEFGNHYTRAMSGYASFISASGFYFHGPAGIIGFDPKINPKNFQSAFITSEGWGSIVQKMESNLQRNKLTLSYGQLTLNQFKLNSLSGRKKAEVFLNGERIKSNYEFNDNIILLKFDNLRLKKGDILEINVNVS